MILEGSIPKSAERLTREWAAKNRGALNENWRLAREGLLPNMIGGLDD